MKIKKFAAFTILELMAGVAIVALIAAIGYTSSRGVMRRSNLVSQMQTIKGTITRARARAVEFKRPVQVTFSSTGRVLALIDLDGGGVFGVGSDGNADTDELVVGESTTQGSDVSLRDVLIIPLNDSEINGSTITHPSGIYDITPSGSAYSTFPTVSADTGFLISSTGLVQDPGTAAPTRGTIFFKTNDNKMLGLLHLTPLGESKIAIKEQNQTTWDWQ